MRQRSFALIFSIASFLLFVNMPIRALTQSDSLLKLANSLHENDTNKMVALQKLCALFQNTDPDSGIVLRYEEPGII